MRDGFRQDGSPLCGGRAGPPRRFGSFKCQLAGHKGETLDSQPGGNGASFFVRGAAKGRAWYKSARGKEGDGRGGEVLCWRSLLLRWLCWTRNTYTYKPWFRYSLKMDAVTATKESKDQGEVDRRKSTPISPRTTPTSSTGSGAGGSTPPEGETTTDQDPQTRRGSSIVSQHPNWRLSRPPEQEQARRQSLSYTHEHPPRRPSSLILLQQPPRQPSLSPKDQDPATAPYRPPPIRQSSLPHDQGQDQQDPTSETHYRPPLHVMTTPMSPWPVTLLPGHHPLPYPFTPDGAAPTPYPSISMPTPLHIHSPYPHPSPLHLQSPLYPQPLPYPHNLPTPISLPPPPFPGFNINTLGGPTTDLQAQQSYLLHALQKEHERAERLVGRYNALLADEGGGGGGAGGLSSRKAKKEAASLRARIEEAGRQETMIVGRLGEVWSEGRGRGRWEGGVGVGVGGGGVGFGGAGGDGGVSATGGGSGRVGSIGGGGSGRRDSTARASVSVSDGRRKSAAVLSPLVAEFVPGAGAAAGKRASVGSKGRRVSVTSAGQRTGGVVFADDIWGGEEGVGRKGSEDGGGRGPTSVCGGEEGGGEKVVEFDDLLWEFESEEEGSGKDDADATGEGSEKKKVPRQRRISMHHAPPISFKAARDKRMSLPSLKTLWPRSHTVPEGEGGEEEEEEDGGFF